MLQMEVLLNLIETFERHHLLPNINLYFYDTLQFTMISIRIYSIIEYFRVFKQQVLTKIHLCGYAP